MAQMINNKLWIMPPYRKTDGGPYVSVLHSLRSNEKEVESIIIFGEADNEIRVECLARDINLFELPSLTTSIYGLAFPKQFVRKFFTNSNAIRVEGFYGLPILFALIFSKPDCKIEVIPHGAIGQPNSNSRFLKIWFEWLVSSLTQFKSISLNFLAFSKLERRYIQLRFPKSDIKLQSRKIEFASKRDSQAKELSFALLGRLSPEKGIVETLNLFKSFRNISNAYKLKIAGSGEPHFSQELKKLCIKLDLGDSVEFLGWLDNDAKNEFLSKISGLICLSPFESLGLSVLEAIQYRVPIFTTSNVGASEFVKQLGIGFVNVNPNELLSDFKYFVEMLDMYSEQYTKLYRKGELVLIP